MKDVYHTQVYDMLPVVIRPETPSDVAGIRDLTDRAFKAQERGNHYESAVVDGLRDSGALTLSLVAVPEPSTDTAHSLDTQSDEPAERLIGHVAFSPITIDGQPSQYYGLGPISVHPSSQRQGIGRALVHAGLARLRTLEAKGVVLIGNPAFYTRLGFKHSDRLWYAGAPKEHFMVYQLNEEDKTSGEIRYHEGFSVNGSS